MKKLLLLPVFLAATWLASSFSPGQMPGAGSPAGVNATLTKLFGKVTAFSAQSDVRVLDKDQKETMNVVMDFSFLDNKVRVEIDMTQMKTKDLPPGAAESLKQMGMDRVVSVIRPDKMATYIIYPRMQSYVNMPLPKEDADTLAKDPKMEKTALGKETIDGHPCVKNKVVITDDKGRKNEATVWNATDLKDFPVQIQSTEMENTVVMRYRQIQFTKPDAKQFEPPTGFTEYSDVPQLMQGAMKKMMGGQSGK